MSVLFQELRTTDGGLEPLRILLEVVIKHGEKPNLAALKPDEFVGVVDASITIQTAEITAELLIDGMVKPEWQTVFTELFLISRSQLLKINFSVHIVFKYSVFQLSL